MIFYIYDRWGKQIGTLQDVISARHKDEINGEDSLSISFVGEQLVKGQRIVWRDKFGAWHEHTVSDLTTIHEEGAITTDAYCRNSIDELLTDYIIEKRPEGTSTVLLSVALEKSRWQIGTTKVTGSFKTSWYHISAYEAITDIVEKTGGELLTQIEVTGSEITARKVGIVQKRGSRITKRFTYGRNVVGIERTFEADEVYTALYGYGKGVEKIDTSGEATGGFSRKITFESVNNGQAWVGDENARLIWGLPDGKGGVKHTFGKVEFSDCEDPAELLKLTKEALKESCKPKVRYEAKIPVLAIAGFANGEDSQTGDDVFLYDKELSEKAEGRVVCYDRDLLNEANSEATLGNLVSSIIDSLVKNQADLDWLKSRAAGWDAAATLPDYYLDAVRDRLNQLFMAGGSYKFESFEKGTIYASVPMDENGLPLKTPATAMQLTGLGFRIASEVGSNGDFVWRTFGTGAGFTADEIIAGIIKGGSNWWNLSTGDLLFMRGIIRNADGLSSWDLEKGVLKTNNMSATNIDASGRFSCGTPDNLLVVENGSILGYENSKKLGSIGFTGTGRDITSGRTYRGPEVYGDEMIGFVAPWMGVAPNREGNGYWCVSYSNLSYLKSISSDDDGNVWGNNSYITFTNGFCTGV